MLIEKSGHSGDTVVDSSDIDSSKNCLTLHTGIHTPPHIYIYIYIYVCMYVCVCVYLGISETNNLK